MTTRLVGGTEQSTGRPREDHSVVSQLLPVTIRLEGCQVARGAQSDGSQLWVRSAHQRTQFSEGKENSLREGITSSHKTWEKWISQKEELPHIFCCCFFFFREKKFKKHIRTLIRKRKKKLKLHTCACVVLGPNPGPTALPLSSDPRDKCSFKRNSCI